MPEHQNETIGVLKSRFDRENPNILFELAEHWNVILERAGLEFDVDNVKVPVQLNEVLEAYVKLKNSDQIVPYNLLSAGIRNFIFRFGHIFSLYFARQIDRGFLLLDEPETSLYSDFQYNIIDMYWQIVQNTQFFVATHSPIIASQFRPEERIILEFQDDGSVGWNRGISPEGADPNSLLIKDFGVRSIYPRKGVEMWERYLQLRLEIKATDDVEKKNVLIGECAKIGNAYNF